MLPGPDVARRAAGLAAEHGCATVWFGAAAPLALLGPSMRRRSGIERVVGSTHGHEVGWSMLPVSRRLLRRIGRDADALTAVSRFTRTRLASAFGNTTSLEHLPPGVDTDAFRPDPAARSELRRRYRIGDAPVVSCISRLVARKGQDTLIAALPELRRRVPGSTLLLVGEGPDAPRLRRLAVRHGVAGQVVFTGQVSAMELAAHHAVGDVFALPCRTRRGGMDVEGLGIALLEAAASGLPVVAGRSGGAPETVLDGDTGHLVDGGHPPSVAAMLADLLGDRERAAQLGAAGRAWMRRDWSWRASGERLSELLDPTTSGLTQRSAAGI